MLSNPQDRRDAAGERQSGRVAEYSQRPASDLERFWSRALRRVRAAKPAFFLVLSLLALAEIVGAKEPLPPAIEGEIAFPASSHPQESLIPAPYQLAPHRFAYRRQPLRPVSDRLTISLVQFPSPVVTTDEVNNMVHCEYYQPLGKHTGRGVVVLHILGGDFNLSRIFCNRLAQAGVSALFLKMPYYGEAQAAAGR